METSITEKLNNIENFLERIESKLDNFRGFENISKEEELEIVKIKKEMNRGEVLSYDNVFN